MAQESFTFADITGTPQYSIGLELGIFIFITEDGRWHVRWNGNEKGVWPITFFYLWGGDISAPTIKNISPYKFDPGQPDNFSTRRQLGSDVLNFNGVVFSDEDGLDFDVEGDQVHFTLTGTIKDHTNVFLTTSLIFMGPNKINPTATDFVVNRNAPPPVQTPTLLWTDSGPSDIQSAVLSATPVPATLLTTQYTAYGFAVDQAGQKIYWSDTGKSIYTANLDGTNVSTLIAGMSFVAYGLALDLAQNLAYCADQRGGVLYRVNLGSGQADALVTGLSGPVDVALDLAGGKVYWAEYNGGSIGCANTDGSGVSHPLTDLNFPQGIALDAINGIIYWADKTSIQRANIDGSHMILMANLTGTPTNMLSRRVALDPTASTLYWTDRGGFMIQRIGLNASAGTPETVLGDLSSPALLAPPLYG